MDWEQAQTGEWDSRVSVSCLMAAPSPLPAPFSVPESFLNKRSCNAIHTSTHARSNENPPPIAAGWLRYIQQPICGELNLLFVIAEGSGCLDCRSIEAAEGLGAISAGMVGMDATAAP